MAEEFVWLIVAVAVAAAIGAFIYFVPRAKRAEETVAKLQKENEELLKDKEHATRLDENLKVKTQSLERAEETIRKKSEKSEKDAEELGKLREKLREKEDEHTQMQAAFKTLAEEALKEQVGKFDKDSKKTLEPLQAQIKEFRERVDAIHTEETKHNESLKTEIETLHRQTAQIGQKAEGLADALRGDKKLLGNWGELTMERLLEFSGLEENTDYELQPSLKSVSGETLRPDAIIYLPEEKHLIVDSKVSLVDYSNFVNADNEEQRTEASKRHLKAVTERVKELSGKYENLQDVNAPEFVFMFMPIEPAFFAALKTDPKLYSQAYNKKVILCAATTLLPILRTVAHIRRIEKHHQNAQKIAERGAVLYDKFVNFVKDMEDVGKGLDKAREAHENAYSKLTSGRGNLVGQAEKLLELGVNPQKRLPKEVASLSQEDGND